MTEMIRLRSDPFAPIYKLPGFPHAPHLPSCVPSLHRKWHISMGIFKCFDCVVCLVDGMPLKRLPSINGPFRRLISAPIVVSLCTGIENWPESGWRYGATWNPSISRSKSVLNPQTFIQDVLHGFLMYKISMNWEKFVCFFFKLCYWNVELVRGQSFENVVILVVYRPGRPDWNTHLMSPNRIQPVQRRLNPRLVLISDVVLCQ